MRPNEASQPEPLGYLLTWSTYGVWLPGDERGWTRRNAGQQRPNHLLARNIQQKLKQQPVILNDAQRQLVEATIRRHCALRNWELMAVNCRTNHVHLVVAAPLSPDEIQRQLKTWCSRELSALDQRRDVGGPAGRRTWWGNRGSGRYLNDERSLEAAILYVRDAQDERPGWK